MTAYILKIDGYQTILGDAQPEIVQPPTRVLGRQGHDQEIKGYDLVNKDAGWTYGGDGVHSGPIRNTVVEHQVGMPEVYRIAWQSYTLTQPWKDLVAAMNPKVSYNQSLKMYFKGVALCNTQEFLCDQTRWCGGAIGEIVPQADGQVFLKSLFIDDPVPSLSFMNAHPELYYWGTTIMPSGRHNFITSRGPDGTYYPLRVPLLSRGPIILPLSRFDVLPGGFTFAPYDPRLMAATDGSISVYV